MDKQFDFENRAELEETGKFIGAIGYKPNSTLLIVLLAGLACVLVFRNTFGLIFGGFLIAVAGVVLFLIKDHPVMEIYDDALILIDYRDNSRVMRIPLEDIKEWTVNRNQSYTIDLKLSDGQELSSQSFQIGKANDLLKKILPGKSTDELMRKKIQSQKSAGFSFRKKK